MNRQRGEVGRVVGGRDESVVIDAVMCDHHLAVRIHERAKTLRRIAAHADQDSGPASRGANYLTEDTTLVRSCHSGWSKNVRSWIVTTVGTADRSGIV